MVSPDPIRWPYLLTIFLGAFLLFQVQPMIGKYILPWFGGMPAVWATCLLFFQVLLLAGYAYAHFLTRRLSARAQGWLHTGVVLATLLLLAYQAISWAAPVLPRTSFKPGDSNQPIGRILFLLTMGVGLPYFLLSSTSPLLQAWFHRTHPTRSPYRLYGLSNAGSMLALLSYPFLIEPVFRLTTQAQIWTCLFGLFAMGIVFLAIRISRQGPKSPGANAEQSSPPAESPGWDRYLLWLCLSACASTLLLAITNHMTQEVAVIPFLWILPLALYLLSFILTFESERWYSRRVFGPFLLMVTFFATVALFRGSKVAIPTQVVLFSACLFVCCMICHGELVRQKPDPKYLTSFYLMVSLGGALGGLFVAILAPLVFDGYWELHLSLFACCGFFLLLLAKDRQSWLNRSRTLAKKILVAGLLIALGAVLIVQTQTVRENALVAVRSFYGVLRVDQSSPGEPLHGYTLVHGKTIHGQQFAAAERRRIPRSYYGHGSGGELAFKHHPRRSDPDPEKRTLHTGVIGLGVGTLAAYGQQGDTMRFYEINPQVVEFAEGDGGYFSYLKDSSARIDISLGDARIQMEKERDHGGPQNYDILVVDAFSSDSVPVHLLTVEAFELYFHHLKPDGILALHLSNRYLSLEWLAKRQAAHFNMPLIAILHDGERSVTRKSLWVLITRNEEFLAKVAENGILIRADPNQTKFDTSLWTDDFSNLVEILN